MTKNHLLSGIYTDPQIYTYDLCGTGCSVIKTGSQDLPYRLRVWVTDQGGDCHTFETFYGKRAVAGNPSDLVLFRALDDAHLWFMAARVNFPKIRQRLQVVANHLKHESTYRAERYRQGISAANSKQSQVMGNNVPTDRIQRADEMARGRQSSLFPDQASDPNL